MEEFLAVAAHDLRTPLTATAGFIDLAERQGKRLEVALREESHDLTHDVAAVRSHLEQAKQSAERLRRLLALLFDTAAIRAGKLQLHCAPVDLAESVREQVEALRAAAPERMILLHLAEDGASIPVDADADRIGQVITNFVTNALKYSPSDRPVDVTVAARGGQAGVARVLVCDQGPGIPKEELGHVWDLFHRVPGVSPQSGTYGGSLGLGLHICKAIITAHGGRVGVKSTAGHGSTFWFTLPLASLQSQGADTTA
jgi:signal transduction histidine kinase